MHLKEMNQKFVRTPVLGKGCVTIESFIKHDNDEKESGDFYKAHVTTLSNSYPVRTQVLL